MRGPGRRRGRAAKELIPDIPRDSPKRNGPPRQNPRPKSSQQTEHVTIGNQTIQTSEGRLASDGKTNNGEDKPPQLGMPNIFRFERKPPKVMVQ
mmetsp:Transcript_18795/g.39580  ORF Transcript_18795/g.39580 Transcript_18795/m.39580 type:complete len:94 (-) Transcript_18795:846-1127(-)